MIRPSNRQSIIPISIFVSALAISRIPLLSGGFGSDPDAWRNAVAGLHSLHIGHYEPSRVPGFPVFDLLVMGLVRHGPLATNAAMLIAGIIAALLFWRVARHALRERSGLAAVAFAFGTPLWVQSGQTMDYALGTAFALGGYLALIRGRAGLAGILLACAAGSRLSLVLLAPGALFFIVAARDGLTACVRFVLGFAVTLLALFVPVLLWSGSTAAPSDFAFHARRQHVTFATLVPVLRAAVAFTLGKLGFLVVATGLVVAARRALLKRGSLVGARAAARRPAHAVEHQDLSYRVFEWFAVIALVVFYLIIPLDVGYLVPVVPFALLLVFRALPGLGWAVVLAVAIMSEPLVVPLLGERRVAAGSLFQERAQRRADLAETRSLADRVGADSTVFVLGRFGIQRLMWIRPGFERTRLAWMPFHAEGVALRDPTRAREYAAYLSAAQLDSLQAAGFAIERLDEDAR